MFARKLIERFDTYSDQLTDEVVEKLTRSHQCNELMRKVPRDEQRQSIHETYKNVAEWLIGHCAANSDFYKALGLRRAQQGVPFCELLFAVSAVRDYFWDYVERETLLDVPADFWGGMKLLQSINRCFDSALYFVSIGYQEGNERHTPQAVMVSGEDR
jgi:hypothetical protein